MNRKAQRIELDVLFLHGSKDPHPENWMSWMPRCQTALIQLFSQDGTIEPIEVDMYGYKTQMYTVYVTVKTMNIYIYIIT